jgi:2-polyprenyl-3-methyl-5-hydroxy-6-metoxy-1,4-benzoquinol methylase
MNLLRDEAAGKTMESKFELGREKYKLPYHWIRDPLNKYSLPYFGYIQVVLDELPPVPISVLDAGCGDGRVSSEMVQRGHSVIGIDQLELSIIYAKNLVPQASFLVGDLRKDLISHYGLQEHQFDAITMIEVYEHIPPQDCPTILANLYQVLKPDGTFIISVPSKSLSVMSKLHYRHFSQSEIERELEKGGFQIQKMIYQHRLDRLTNWLLSNAVEKLLDNRWLQIVFLKRLRRHWYMKYANVVSKERNCQRFIAVAKRQIVTLVRP